MGWRYEGQCMQGIVASPRALLAAVFLSVVLGCTQSGRPSSTPASLAAHATADPSRRSSEPESGGIPSSQPERSHSWAARMGTLAPHERSVVEARNARYLGALVYTSPEELRALRAMGYPTVSDLLAAESLSDVELKQLAASGHGLAKALYADRLVTRLEAMPSPASTGPQGAERDRVLLSAEANSAARDALASTRTPFAAMVMGAQQAATYHGASEPRVAGALAARSLGDERIANLMLASPMAPMDASAVVAVYHVMLSTVKR